jgi:hypothetical protein
MAFSSIAFCAEDKMTIDFHTYPLLCGAVIHQSSMGIHKSGGSPFVELTVHKPLVHSSFEMAKLNVPQQFVLTERVHSFTSNTRNVRGETFLPQKEIYSHKFPVMTLSQLVGGFVGSKSQLGSCGRESFQIWDIIFDKLAEFCRAPQCGCSSCVSENPRNCYNLGNNLSQEIFGSFCQESVSTPDGSHIIIENSSNPMQDKVSDTLPQPSTVSCNSVPVSVKPLSVMSACTQNDNKFCHMSDVSRQSYAEVAKAFAIAQQSKQQYARTSTLKRRRNTPYCGDLRNNLRQFSWRYCHESSVRNYGNQHMLAISCRKTPHSSKVVSMHKVGTSKTSDTNVNISESNSKKNIHELKKKSQTALYKKVYPDCSQVADKSTIAENSNCVGSVEDKFVKPCTAIKCSSSAIGVVDDCTVFNNKAEDGNVATVIDASGIVQTSPSNLEHHQCSGESAARERYLSDCSTDSDDSFVSFECGVDCKPVTVALVSDSEPSEEGVSDQFSDDDDGDDDDDDDDDDNEESGDTEVRNKDYKTWNIVT